MSIGLPSHPASLTAPAHPGLRLKAPVIMLALLLVPILWCAAYAIVGGWIGDNPTLFIDVPSFHYAADTAFNWNASPYDAGTIWAWKYHTRLSAFPFLYPPPALALFAPLSLLSFIQTLALLLAINVAAMAVTVGVLYQRYVRPLPGMGWICIGLAILCLNYGFVRTILNGQINLVVLLLILLAWSTAGQRRWALLTGLALAGAILLKTYPVVLLALFVLRRDWRVVGACLGGVAAVTLASAAFVPATAWSGWLHNVVPTGGWGTPVFMLFEPSHYANLSLNGLLSRLLDSGTVGLLAFPLTALVLGVTFAVLWRLRDLEARAFHDWAFPITLVATFLVAPLSWYHHAVFLLPGLLLLVGEAAKRQGMPSACLVGIVLLNSFYWSPIARQVEWVSTIPALGVVALWVALLVVADRSRQGLPSRMATTWAASVHPDGHVAGRDL